MNELVGFLTILLFCLLKLNQYLKNKNIPKTQKEKDMETQEFFEQSRKRCHPNYSYLGRNINNDD